MSEPPWCDDPNGEFLGYSETGRGWRPSYDSPAGNPFKYKDVPDIWIAYFDPNPTDIDGNPIPPDQYYIGPCAPLKIGAVSPPSNPEGLTAVLR